MSRRCSSRHRKMWLIAGGYWCWCYECGAIRLNDADSRGWTYPTGPGGENPDAQFAKLNLNPGPRRNQIKEQP